MRNKGISEVVLIHGRSQEGKDPEELKEVWVKSLKEGLRLKGLKIPEGVRFRFPYYGDALKSCTEEKLMRSEREMTCEAGIMLEIAKGLLDEKTWNELFFASKSLDLFSDENFQKLLKLLERNSELSAACLRYFVRDAAVYLSRKSVREKIDNMVIKELASGTKIIIGHSLGSVIGYEVLTKADGGIKSISLFMTLGSPLGLSSVNMYLSKPLRIPETVEKWFNAFDERDFIALNKLDKSHFPPEEGIINYGGVKNEESNHHGVEGYLKDPVVASSIFKAIG